MDLFLQMLVNGVTVGGTYALAAIGISLIFGILNIINFGHGAALTIGAYVAMVMLNYLGLGLVAAFAIAVVSSFLTGYLIERVAVRPLVGAPILMPLISTLGIGIALENVVQFIFGPQTQPFPTGLSHEPFMLGGATVSVWELATMIVTVVTIAALHLLLHHTNFGTAVRAIAEDRRTAALLGIDVDRTIVLTFCLASALGGLAGVLSAALYNTIDPVMGSAAMLKAFAASVLGGMEVVAGAIIGGLVLGIVESATSIYFSSAWRDGVALILLVLVLLFKPTGLLGQRSLEKVERQSLTVLPLPPVPQLKLGQPLFWIGLGIALVLPLIFTDPYSRRILTMMLLFGTLALSLNLIAGFAGIISLAHATFYGIGAYVSAILTTSLDLPVPIGFIAAVLFTGLFGIAFAWPVMRLRGHYVAMGTLGMAGVMSVVMLNWIGLTNGPMGIRSIPPPSLLGHEIPGVGYYYLVLALLVVSTVIVVALLDSAFGRALRAMRDDDLGAASVGVDSRVMKMVAFGAAAAIAGACGSFWAHFASFISPDGFGPMESIGILAMVVLGGLGSIPGSILGGAFLTALPEVLRFTADYRQAIYGVLLLLVVLFRPQGLLGFVAAGYRPAAKDAATPAAREAAR